jgi:hypothetical protein
MITTETAKIYVEKLREFIDAASSDYRESDCVKGYSFERRFAAMCESRGMHVVRAGPGHFDYIVNCLRVQCKCNTPGLTGRVNVQPGDCSAYEVGSFDALAIETQNRLYLVPAEDMPLSKKSGRIAPTVSLEFLSSYLDAWWVIERGERPAGFVRQLPLWSTDEEDDDGR